jgi:uncharacterized protein involved in cysteine biosynthesis
MLNFSKKKFKWAGRAQSGFYIDFILKKLAEVFIRNVFINAALFLGEKYMIEYITKKTVDSLIFNSNKFIGWTTYNYRWFFYLSITTVFYLLLIFNIFLIFF